MQWFSDMADCPVIVSQDGRGVNVSGAIEAQAGIQIAGPISLGNRALRNQWWGLSV
jgi:hypothetical protein